MTALDKAPGHWRQTTIGEIAEVAGGIQKQPSRLPRSNTAPFLRVANVQRGSLDLTDVHRIELFEGELPRFRLRRGDLLVVEGNGSIRHIGRSALWTGEIADCVHQNHLIRVRPGPEVLPEFLNHYWNSPAAVELIRGVAQTTSGLYTLSTGKVRSVPVAVPPLGEQRAIVETIERMLSHAEAAAHAVSQVDRRADLLRQATLNSAVTSGSETLGSARCRDWPETTLDQVLQPLHDGRLLHQGWSPQCDAEPAVGDEWGVLKTTAVQPGHFDGSHNKRLPAPLSARPDLEVQAGDILMTCAGPRSRCGVATLVPMTRGRLMFSGKIYRFRANPEVVLPGFLEAYLLSPRGLDQIESMKTGISESGLNLTRSRFLGLRMPVPELNEQRSIVEKLGSDLPRVARLRAALATVLGREAVLRRSILKLAFEGRLTGAAQDALSLDDPQEAIA